VLEANTALQNKSYGLAPFRGFDQHRPQLAHVFYHAYKIYRKPKHYPMLERKPADSERNAVKSGATAPKLEREPADSERNAVKSGATALDDNYT